MSSIVIIGSSNVDYLGVSFNKLIDRDSNIGKISVSSGGVGRNICENLLRLGEDVTFITAIGNDLAGEKIEKELKDLKCKIIKPLTNKPTASYLAIHDEIGDMALALCDTSIIDDLSNDLFEHYKDLIKSANLLVFDGNLTPQTLDYLFKTFENKIIVDGISTSKVIKFKDYLSKIYVLKVNSYEYDVIKPFISDDNIPQYLIVTSGKDSIKCITKEQEYVIEIEPIEEVVNTTGAGDAFISGVISSLTHNDDIFEAIKKGDKLAKLTLTSKSSVYKE